MSDMKEKLSKKDIELLLNIINSRQYAITDMPEILKLVEKLKKLGGKAKEG